MEIQLKNTELSTVRFLLGSNNSYLSWLGQAKELFKSPSFNIDFATPNVSEHKNTNYWQYSSMVKDLKLNNFSDLSEAEKDEVGYYLNEQLGKVINNLTFLAPEKRHQGEKFVKMIIEIPDWDDIWYYINDEGKKIFVLTNWACNFDTYNPNSGLISSKTKGDKFHAWIKVMYDDGSPVPNFALDIEHNSEKENKIADIDGLIDMGFVLPKHTAIASYANEENKIIKKQDILFENSEPIPFIIDRPKVEEAPLPPKTIDIRVAGKKKFLSKNNSFFFSINEGELQQTAVINNIARVEGLKEGDKLTGYVLYNEKKKLNIKPIILK